MLEMHGEQRKEEYGIALNSIREHSFLFLIGMRYTERNKQ